MSSGDYRLDSSPPPYEKVVPQGVTSSEHGRVPLPQPADDLPPPSYESFTERLKKQRASSNNLSSYLRGATKIGCTDVKKKITEVVLPLMLLIPLFYLLPVAEIVIGSMFFNDCPFNTFLPKYPIVSGACSIVGASLFVIELQKAKNCKKQNCEASTSTTRPPNKFMGCRFGGMIIGFLFFFQIAGAVQVFNVKPCMDGVLSNKTSEDDRSCYLREFNSDYEQFYCNPLLFDFVFIELVTKFAVVALFLCGPILYYIFVTFTYCCRSTKTENIDSAGS